MKRIYVNEKWCLGCHLCEYYCAFANSGKSDMVKALKGSLRMVGNHSKSAKAEGSLTATPTGGAGTKVGLSDPVV